MRRWSLIGILVILAFFACAKNIRKGASRVDELKLPGNFADCIMADFDGDNLTEIIAFSIDSTSVPDDASQSSRKGTVFHLAPDGSPVSSIAFNIPDEAVVFDWGDINSDGRPEVIYMSGDGLFSLRYPDFETHAPNPVVEQPTIFLLPTTTTVSSWDIFRTSRSNRSYLLLPCLQGITIYEVASGQIDSLGTITIRHHAAANTPNLTENREITQLTYNCALPMIQIADYDGDNLDDIFIILSDRVKIYQGLLSGGFASQPLVTFDPVKHTTHGESESEIVFQIDDLNSDGRADMIVTQTSGGITRFESQIDIYLCRSLSGYEKTPSYTRTVSKSAGLAYLNDFNSDGRTDLAVPALELGILPLIKMLILNRLDLHLEVFLQEGGGRFPAEPSLKKTITTSVDINSGNITYGDNIALRGDFNGDRLSDFLLDSGKGELRVYFGVAGTVFSDEFGWSASIPHPTSILTSDLNHDGRHEILAFYGPRSQDPNTIRMVSVNPGK